MAPRVPAGQFRGPRAIVVAANRLATWPDPWRVIAQWPSSSSARRLGPSFLSAKDNHRASYT